VDFQFTVTAGVGEVRGTVRFEGAIEMDDGAGGWEAVPAAPGEVRLPIGMVQDIAQGPGTRAEKLLALQAEIVAVLSALPEVLAAKRTELLDDALPDLPVVISFSV